MKRLDIDFNIKTIISAWENDMIFIPTQCVRNCIAERVLISSSRYRLFFSFL